MAYLGRERFRPGSEVRRRKGPAEHVGIYLADDYVLQNTPERGEHATTIEGFTQGQIVTPTKIDMPLDELYARVKAVLANPRPYNLFTNNCEHTVTRVLEGETCSRQLQGWIATGVLAGLVVAAVVKGNREGRAGHRRG